VSPWYDWKLTEAKIARWPASQLGHAIGFFLTHSCSLHYKNILYWSSRGNSAYNFLWPTVISNCPDIVH
jgi:hypothetical protein